SNQTYRVNRFFNSICTPYVYQEMCLSDSVGKRTDYIAKRYGQHVLMLRVFMIMDVGTDKDIVDQVAALALLCPKVQGIALYYSDPLKFGHNDFPIDQILPSIIQSNELRSLGIHLKYPNNSWPMEIPVIDKHMEIIGSSGVVNCFKDLNISVSIVTGE
ncbi:17098_t:CDS:1, partial [Acaulospora colombiana]